MTGLGSYLGALADVAEQADEPRLARLAEELGRPLRVGVRGRRGAGCATVTRALRRRGVGVVGAGEARDVDVHVLVETLKPEDAAALGGPGPPRLAVLNKADLGGLCGDGPLARAASQCTTVQAECRIPTFPLAGLLAAAVVDDDMVGALSLLAREPADLGSTDRFVAGVHPLPRAVRERLLAELELFGIAHAVLAVRGGADRTAVNAALQRLSGVDAVLAGVEEAGAAPRYRRILDATPVLAELSAGPGGARVAELLAGDRVVTARMAAAVDALTAVGVAVDDGDSRAGQLRCAVRWQRHGTGPLSPIYRACAADIVRGSLRRWAASGGVPEAAR